MAMTKEEMQNVLSLYFKAWQDQDSTSLIKLFAKDGIYRVRPFGLEEFNGTEAIKGYWEEHPVKGQTNPRPKMLNSAFGNDMCFAEWENTFINKVGKSKKTQGMLILEFKNGLIQELREHYLSVEID